MTLALERASTVLANIFLAMTCVLIALMAVHVTADVFCRVVLRAPLAATLEIGTYYYMIGATFLPFAAVQLKRENIAVDFVVLAVPPQARVILQILADLLAALTAGALTYYAGVSALEKFTIGEFTVTQSFDLALWPSRLIPVAGFGTLALVLIVQIFQSVLTALRDDNRAMS